MRVAPDGKATKVFEGKELGVQALRVGADGRVMRRLRRMGRCIGWGCGGGEWECRGGGVRSGADGGEAEVSCGMWR